MTRGRLEVPHGTLIAIGMVAMGAAYVGYILLTGELTATLARLTSIADQVESGGDATGPNRLKYWATAYKLWLSAPLIGHGLNSFSVLYTVGRKEAPGSHPHDIFLQIAAEMGTVGLFLIGVFMWTALRHCSFSRLRRDPLLVCALLFVITSSMSALFGRDIVGARKFFFALGLLALRPAPATVPSTAAADEKEEEDEERSTARRGGRGSLAPRPVAYGHRGARAVP